MYKTTSQILYTSPFTTLQRDSFRFHKKERSIEYFTNIPTGVIIIARKENGDIALVRHYRYPTGTTLWEIPGGMARPRALLQSAKKELHEETGIIAKRWKKIGSFLPLASRMTTIAHLYLAQTIHEASLVSQDEEIVMARWFSLKKTLEMVRKKKINDAQSIASLYIYQQYERTK